MAGWYFDKITLHWLRVVFIRAGAAMVRLTVERREKAGRLAGWQARLRADRDFD